MKTKFTVNEEVFLNNGTPEECFKYYEDNFKQFGFELDKENEDVYKMFDTEFHLNEGDRVNLCGLRIVEWKCVDIDCGFIEYALIIE